MRTPVSKRLRSAKRVKQGSVFSLPDDLLILILIRLLVEDVLRCRCVCRRWRDLTSTEYFIHTYRPRSAPVILAAYSNMPGQHDLFSFRRWWEREPTKSRVCSLNHNQRCFLPRWDYQCSGDGLLAFKFYDLYSTKPNFYNPEKFIIFNPFFGKKRLTVVLPESIFSITKAFAIYFHPTLKEYCVLWKVHPNPDEGDTRYMILNLGPKPCWKRIRNPWTHKFENPVRPTVLIHRYLYWLVEYKEGDEHNGDFVIMKFDILYQELKLMLLPISAAVKYNGYNKDLLSNTNINLLDACGQLSLFLISSREGRVHQWTLESPEEELWKSWVYNINYEGYGLYKPLRPVAFVDQHLLVRSLGSDLTFSFPTVLNLKRGKIRELKRVFCSPSRMAFSHVISLAYLRNCKSKIVIDENDDNKFVTKLKFSRTPPEEKSWRNRKV